MNWQSDFVSPHFIQNGQNYIQQLPASKQTTNMLNSNTTYGSSYNQNTRYNPNTSPITPQYNPIPNQQHQYTQIQNIGHSHQFIPNSVPHFNSHTNQLNSHQSSSSSPVSDGN